MQRFAFPLLELAGMCVGLVGLLRPESLRCSLEEAFNPRAASTMRPFALVLALCGLWALFAHQR